MFLTAPSSSDKPKSNRSQKGVFSNKAPPKIKAWKPPEDEKTPDAPAPKADSPFVAWLKAQKTSSSTYVEAAKAYLLNGPPYKGQSAFGCRDLVTEIGAKWVRNPNKKKDCDDKQIARGWTCALDDQMLLRLLHATASKGEPAWKSDGLTPSQWEQLSTWLTQFYGCHVGPSVQKESTDHVDGGEIRCKRPRQVPDWILNATYDSSWVPDTECCVCSQRVSDQFLECACEDARWKRCSKCNERVRTDTTDQFATMANKNFKCKCSPKGHI